MKTVQLFDRSPFYYEKISVTTAAVFQLNETYRNDSDSVFLTVEDNGLRYRIEGGDPDINDGHVVVAGGNMFFANVKAIKRLRMIGYGGTAIVIVTYYKGR
jgi:hypothetical protein